MNKAEPLTEEEFNRLIDEYYGCDVTAFDQLEGALRLFLVQALQRRLWQGQYQLPRRLASHRAAEGLVLEVLQKVYETKGRSEYDPDRSRSWKNWLLTILDRHVTDLTRKADTRLVTTPEDADIEVPSATPDPPGYNALERALAEEIAQLPTEERELIEAVYMKGRPQTEVASERKLQPSTLSKSLDRIRQQLATRLAERGYRPSLDEVRGGIKVLLQGMAESAGS